MREDRSNKRGKRKKDSFDADFAKKESGRVTGGSDKQEDSGKHWMSFTPHSSVVRYKD